MLTYLKLLRNLNIFFENQHLPHFPFISSPESFSITTIDDFLKLAEYIEYFGK